MHVPLRWRWLTLAPLFMSALLTTAVRAQCTIWNLIHDENPANIVTTLPASMVFDPQAGQCMMLLLWGPQGGVWRWDGALWRRSLGSILAGGAPNYAGIMACDSIRQRVVLLEQGEGRTWETIGTAWLRRDVAGPTARSAFSMCFDPTRGRVVLFGGDSTVTNGPDPLGDTWEWDGQAWMQISTQGPPARLNHAMVFDEARGRALLFGGQGVGGTLLNDTWEWNGSSWSQVASTGPEPRRGMAMVYDSVRHRTVLFGGHAPSAVPFPFSQASDTWEWDGVSWVRVALTGPAPRTDALMAFDPVRARTVLFGGWNRSVQLSPQMSETWEWDGVQWTQHGPTEPQNRQNHGMAYDTSRGEAIIFGGTTVYSAPDARTTWAWDGDRWARRAESGPTPRSGHAMVYDAARNRTVLFGGSQSGGTSLLLGDTWEWDGDAWTQREVPGPSPRRSHQMVYDQSRARTVLYGGTSSTSSGGIPYGDTWEWDGVAWTQIPVSGPPATAEHAMAYDAARQRTVLFTPSRTWEFDGFSWQLALINPEMMWGRTNAAFAYDADRQRCVLYGGGSHTGLLEWDGSSWSLLAQFYTGPQRYGAPMVFDTARSRFVLFGGSGRGDTRELPSSPARPQFDSHPVGGQVHAGQTVALSVSVSGDGPFTYQWHRQNSNRMVTDGPGGASLDGGTVSGANTPTLTITGIRPSDTSPFDPYRCLVTNACGTLASYTASFSLYRCGSPDFDNDGAPGTDADIEAFFACLAGSCCPTCGTADFNSDGDTGTDADIEAFFRVLAGGTC
jgi:hypothetical protein